jgi:ATP-dependent Clp protease ATP-binding subunit ClpX
MLDIMYELPDQEDGAIYTVNAGVVQGSEKLFKMPKSKSA